MVEEKPDNTDPKLSKPYLFKKGAEWTGNAAGRPKGSISIKDRVRNWLEDHPEDMEKFVKHFVNENRELGWTMMEGAPKATTEVNTKTINIELTGEDLRLAKELEYRRQTKIHEPSASSDGSAANTLG